jgi:nitrous oxide reductase accessory protein NosL
VQFILLLAGSLIATAAQATEDYAVQPIAKAERCPVCGMYPANFPQWHAQIVFKDGEHSSFDSAAELFRFLNNMAKYDKKHVAADIGKIFVPAYNKGAWLDAKQAFFVAGSKIKGPMGNDLPAFASRDEAVRFSLKSGGKTLSFEQITPAVINAGVHEHSH